LSNKSTDSRFELVATPAHTTKKNLLTTNYQFPGKNRRKKHLGNKNFLLIKLSFLLSLSLTRTSGGRHPVTTTVARFSATERALENAAPLPSKQDKVNIRKNMQIRIPILYFFFAQVLVRFYLNKNNNKKKNMHEL